MAVTATTTPQVTAPTVVQDSSIQVSGTIDIVAGSITVNLWLQTSDDGSNWRQSGAGVVALPAGKYSQQWQGVTGMHARLAMAIGTTGLAIVSAEAEFASP